MALLEEMFRKLFQTNPVVAAPLGSVGQDHAVAFAQPVTNFHGADGKPSEFHGRARSFRSVGIQLEKPDGGLRLSECGAADEQDVLHVFDFYRSVDAEVRSRAVRKR